MKDNEKKKQSTKQNSKGLANNKRDAKPFIIQSLRNGAGVRLACKGAKIHHDTFYSWYKEDPDFKAKVDEAKKSRIEILVDVLYMKAKRGHMGALCVYLFNRAPDEWKNTQHVEANVHAPVPISFVHYDPAKHAKPGDAQPGS
jgi:hypothetical protein